MNSNLLVLSIFFTVCITKRVSEQCIINYGSKLECKCVGNEELVLPKKADFSNVTSVFVTSCSRANLRFSNLAETREGIEIVVQNISGHLTLQPFAKIRTLREFKLLRIRKMLLITHDTFASISKIVNFHMEDTWIENFEEQFTNINVTRLILKNVTIDRMIGINLSERGDSLKIHDSILRNVQTSLNFAYFSKIDITNSGFELEKPGHLSIEGNSALVVNSVFTNVSMNLVASSEITINSSCADGKSSLRLSANRIESFGNRLPTEIVYTRNSVSRDNDEFPIIVNNTVCIAGNCKCPKSAGHNSYERFHANVYLGILLLILVPGLF